MKISDDVRVYILTAFYPEYLTKLNGLKEDHIDFDVCRKPLDQDQIRHTINSVLGKTNKMETYFSLKLYIAGNMSGAEKTINDVKRIFGDEVICKYELKVIDVINETHLAMEDNIIATPTLAKVNHDGVHMVIGDISDTENVLNGLGIPLTIMSKKEQ